MSARINLTARGWPLAVVSLVIATFVLGATWLVTNRAYRVHVQWRDGSVELAPAPVAIEQRVDRR